jgi:mRNA export factor
VSHLSCLPLLGSHECNFLFIRQNFSFKCHRKEQNPTQKDQTLVFSVNDINFHPVHGTFSTAGSDGTVNFWDKDARTRLKSEPLYLKESSLFDLNGGLAAAFDTAPGPITCTAFNRTGNIFAYAVSYDWSKGHSGMTAGHPNKIMLHACKEEEVKKRAARK